eukprot:6543649-Pyramimonas_sp.AAC.1
MSPSLPNTGANGMDQTQIRFQLCLGKPFEEHFDTADGCDCDDCDPTVDPGCACGLMATEAVGFPVSVESGAVVVTAAASADGVYRARVLAGGDGGAFTAPPGGQ